MEGVDRRTAMTLGLTAAAASTVPMPAAAATYSPDQGEQVQPGVRRIILGERPSTIPGMKMVRLVDYVLQPGGKMPVETMPMNMVCHTLEGRLQISNNGQEFTAEKNAVWTCNAGGTEAVTNSGSEPAVMRVALLMT